MNVDWKRGLIPHELSEIERKLQYIDFLSSRDALCVDAGENALATAVATLTMSGAPYERGALVAMLGENTTPIHDSQWQRYARAVEMLLSADVDTAFDESRILSLHRSVWDDGDVSAGSANSHSGPLQVRATRDNLLVVPPALQELVEQYLLEERRGTMHPLIAIATLLYEYTRRDTMHHAKEQMLQLLELLLMRRCGCHWVRLYSPCRTMCDDMLRYHRALYADEGSCAQWVVYWISHVYEAALRANDMLSPVKPPPPASPKAQLNARQRRILNYVDKHQPVKLADVVGYMHKESVNTVKKDLYKLHDLGYLLTEGVLKGTTYYKR